MAARPENPGVARSALDARSNVEWLRAATASYRLRARLLHITACSPLVDDEEPGDGVELEPLVQPALAERSGQGRDLSGIIYCSHRLARAIHQVIYISTVIHNR